MSAAGETIIVIGAGIVGVSTAIWLQRFGHRDVVLMDMEAPGSGASHGNAGLIASWGVGPVSDPSLWLAAPKMVMDRNSALFIKWRSLAKVVPWIARFMSNASDFRTRELSGHLVPLLADAVDQHKALTLGTSVEAWVRDSKMSFVYPDRGAFESDALSWELKAAVGMVPELVSGPQVRDVEPLLGPANQFLAVLDGFGHLTDPGGYVAALARDFEREGGRFVRAKVKGFVRDGDRITKVETDAGAFECSKAVITSGAWSKDLMRAAGLSVPLIAERGYHVIYENPSEVPRNPMLMMKGKFGVNAMDMGLRCAGTSELGDTRAGPSKAPIRMIRKRVEREFPDLTYSGTVEWMGFRPSTPDSLPLIGEIGRSGLYTGFGHQHVGLTAGPKTGRLLAQMMTGGGPNMDMSPYAPERFG